MRRATAVLAAVFLAASLGADDPGPQPSDLLDALLATFLDFPARDAVQLQDDVARLGGVAFRQPAPVEYLAPEAVEQQLKELFDAEFPPGLDERDQRMLQAFGLLPAGYDLRAARFRLLLDNVVGFYDDRPGRQRLFVVAAEPKLTPSAQMIAVHELRHALQDQYAPTHHALPDSIGAFDDRRLAYMSLLEGDAALVMELFLRSRRREEAPGRDLSAFLPATELPGVPAVLGAQLLAPYAAGRGFVDALRQARGWGGVRAAWSSPPSTTEQVLHPDAYLRAEPAADLPALRWRRPAPEVEGRLGELLVRVLLEGEPEAASRGWGGDRYELWSDGRLLWRSRWDGAADRDEFRDAARRAWTRRYGAGQRRGPCETFGAAGRAWAWCSAGVEERLLSAPARELAAWTLEVQRAR